MQVLICGIVLALAPILARADTVIAARTLRPATLITAEDVTLVEQTVPGSHGTLETVIGQEARVVLYAGRPVRLQDTRAPALVTRNGLVTLVFHVGGLEIYAEGRALDRAGAGEVVQVMNTASRTRVEGIVTAEGRVRVTTP